MKKLSRAVQFTRVKIAFLLLLSLFSEISSSSPKTVVGYYYFWDRFSFPYTAVKYGNLSVIAHAFIVPDQNGSIGFETGATPQNFLYPELISSAHSNGVRVVVSVGGWGNSSNFSSIAANANARARFAGNLKDFCLQNGYDGVDIDWEYPKSSDRDNLVQMMRQIQDSLRSTGKNLSISIAIPSYLSDSYDYSSLSNIVNWFGVMTYDYHGSWTPHTGFVAPLYDPLPATGCLDGSVSSSINAFIYNTKIPPSIIFMGLAFYGYSFQSAGLYMPWTGSVASLPYSRIVSYEKSGWTYHWDDVSKVPYLTDSLSTHIITFDDTLSIKLKCQFLKSIDLGGAIIWRLGNDYSGNSQPLLETVWNSLNEVTSFHPLIERTNVAYAISIENYPNPFNSSTTILYSLPVSGWTQVQVFDVIGRKVAEIVNGYESSGIHRALFDASFLPSGVYMVQLTEDGRTAVKPILFVK